MKEKRKYNRIHFDKNKVVNREKSTNPLAQLTYKELQEEALKMYLPANLHHKLLLALVIAKKNKNEELVKLIIKEDTRSRIKGRNKRSQCTSTITKPNEKTASTEDASIPSTLCEIPQNKEEGRGKKRQCPSTITKPQSSHTFTLCEVSQNEEEGPDKKRQCPSTITKPQSLGEEIALEQEIIYFPTSDETIEITLNTEEDCDKENQREEELISTISLPEESAITEENNFLLNVIDTLQLPEFSTFTSSNPTTSQAEDVNLVETNAETNSENQQGKEELIPTISLPQESAITEENAFLFNVIDTLPLPEFSTFTSSNPTTPPAEDVNFVETNAETNSENQQGEEELIPTISLPEESAFTEENNFLLNVIDTLQLPEFSTFTSSNPTTSQAEDVNFVETNAETNSENQQGEKELISTISLPEESAITEENNFLLNVIDTLQLPEFSTFTSSNPTTPPAEDVNFVETNAETNSENQQGEEELIPTISLPEESAFTEENDFLLNLIDALPLPEVSPFTSSNPTTSQAEDVSFVETNTETSSENQQGEEELIPTTSLPEESAFTEENDFLLNLIDALPLPEVSPFTSSNPTTSQAEDVNFVETNAETSSENQQGKKELIPTISLSEESAFTEENDFLLNLIDTLPLPEVSTFTSSNPTTSQAEDVNLVESNAETNSENQQDNELQWNTDDIIANEIANLDSWDSIANLFTNFSEEL